MSHEATTHSSFAARFKQKNHVFELLTDCRLHTGMSVVSFFTFHSAKKAITLFHTMLNYS